jgi:hypothetical protein
MARKFKESKELLELKRMVAEMEDTGETEEEYWERLYREFKDEVKVRALKEGVDEEVMEKKMKEEMSYIPEELML